jgi:hypothetical protein
MNLKEYILEYISSGRIGNVYFPIDGTMEEIESFLIANGFVRTERVRSSNGYVDIEETVKKWNKQHCRLFCREDDNIELFDTFSRKLDSRNTMFYISDHGGKRSFGLSYVYDDTMGGVSYKSYKAVKASKKTFKEEICKKFDWLV